MSILGFELRSSGLTGVFTHWPQVYCWTLCLLCLNQFSFPYPGKWRPFLKSWTFKVYYTLELASVCRLPVSGSLTELLKSSPLSFSSQVAFSTTDHASTIAPASPVGLFLCVFDGSLFSLDICYISLLILFFLCNIIYDLSYLFPVTMIKGFDQSTLRKELMSITVEKSQEKLDAAAGDIASAVKKERATSACAQLTFFSLYSPECQSRGWCHTQWVGLPTSKTYQGNPPWHGQRLFSLVTPSLIKLTIEIKYYTYL